MIATIDSEPTVFPGDPVLDDPALLELEPARPQRALDLEAFDFQRRGYSIRQIAKLQKVHPNTAFNRVQRGKEIDAREPLRAEGESLHAEVSKLRQLQQIALAAAVAGDLKAITLVLRISDKLWRLGKFAHELERRAELRKSMQGQRLGMSGARIRRPAGTLTLSEDDEVLWDVMAEFLPQRQEVIEQLKEEFYAAFKANSAEIDRQAEDETTGPTPSQVSKQEVADTNPKRERGHDTSPKRERGFNLPRNDQGSNVGPISLPCQGRPFESVPSEPGVPALESQPKWIPTRRNKALRARARRERRADRARAQHQQSASARVPLLACPAVSS